MSRVENVEVPRDAALLDRIHRLWDDLAAFDAAQTDEAMRHLLREVSEMVDAQNAYWMGAVRLSDDTSDPLLGWRPGVLRYLTPLPNDETFTKQRLKSVQRGKADEATVAHARMAGVYRATRLRDLVSSDWFDTATYAGYVGRNVHDSLVVVAPMNPATESYYGFLRMRADDPFTATQRDTALYALRGLSWFHRQLLLSHGLLVARTPLTPVERKVLAALLTGSSEKQIAEDLALSFATLHTYVRTIYRKFGVSGRSGLTALWLGKRV